MQSAMLYYLTAPTYWNAHGLMVLNKYDVTSDVPTAHAPNTQAMLVSWLKAFSGLYSIAIVTNIYLSRSFIIFAMIFGPF